MLIKFTIAGNPQGKARPRFKKINDKVLAFTPTKTRGYETKVRNEYKETIRYKFPKDIPIAVAIIAYYKIPKGISKIKRKEMIEGKISPTKRPDSDNVIKTILDALNGIAFHDDSQVFRIEFEKRYGEIPMVKVAIANDPILNEKLAAKY
ncbi:MAG: RusA family crossover junction endodeoxyribonuclease [Candidatus Azobacteroides pseudotrichonymphae]|uniref:RusA family crossover junction endodeoxyribonuclease n=1 Tax=Candidatus Improbicoccus pseudotrichonymphae TaxID=3033792 RepID=A0AA48I7W1_9FIRM|nr:MAG: RusA family crossover junction endodeoxyribonuclease [Candidatus Improbicoccus pseudotrichonymphae]GMO34018.1 MAG: RusA family crossover junction endodeoxyribonuclease [Candidatus Azobacteroides pseudotrichonymphae]